MGLFRKKVEKSTVALREEGASAPTATSESLKTEIKIVGNAKHVTTTTLDANGREVKQTVITKLTPDELQKFGRAASTVPQTSEPKATTVKNLPVGDESLATIEVTRELVKGFIADIWNRGEVDLIKKICHPSLRFNGHVGMDRVGHEGFARMVITVREALTDYHCEIHSMVVESNKAFCRLKFTGKHTGSLLGFPPTGKVVSWVGASEFTCKNGKILKVWELGDVKTLETQLRSSEA